MAIVTDMYTLVFQLVKMIENVSFFISTIYLGWKPPDKIVGLVQDILYIFC